jgi:N-acyl-D-aspartate/D-glutamate deacylase
MLDTLIEGGTVVDGTGKPGERADVGIRDGRVVAVGATDELATTTVDAAGLVVTPGFIDPHTHYDAQLFWDPYATPSNGHGFTTVMAGNCGFTLAPLNPDDGDYLRRMMARVEGMPLAALELGLPWDWHSFDDYLQRLDGRIGVNAGFLVGHSALRRAVMREAAVGSSATPEQLKAMQSLLAESLEAGGLGFSSSQAFTHKDGDGEPVPSRHASGAELLALCETVRKHSGTSLEFITSGCLSGFSDVEAELMTRMSLMAQRPLNWNVLNIDAKEPSRTLNQLGVGTRARAAGGRVIALTMPTIVEMNMNLRTFCALFLLPGWDELLELSIPDRIEKLRDPALRRELDARANSEEAGVLRRLAGWSLYTIGDTYSPENEGLKGRTIADVGHERGTGPFETLVDIAIADELRTVLWPSPTDDDPESWQLRAESWQSEDVVLGGSDAGAHLDRQFAASYPTEFLADCLRGRQLVSLEEAVRLMTTVPASLFGLRDRGQIRPGAYADVVVFDPTTIGAGSVTLVADLPGRAKRLTSPALGMNHVFVNGIESVRDGQATGPLAGTLLRAGRDTYPVGVTGSPDR